MSKFKSLVDSSVKQAEAEVSKYWNEVNILEKTLEKGKNDPSFVFYEGPPTANGNPGIHLRSFCGIWGSRAFSYVRDSHHLHESFRW